MPNLSNNPIIIIGMGGSGTRLVARILEECGVFFGAHLARNPVAEPEILNRINSFTDDFRYRLPLRGDWELILLANRSALLEFCRTTLPEAFQGAGYVGGLWGLKDPRNTFTARVFVEAFADAKVLHVVRDPIDVADSKTRQKFRHLPSGLPSEYWLEVWLQTDRVASAYEGLLGDRYYRLKYEDACQTSDRAVRTLSSLANCSCELAKQAMIKHVERDRTGRRYLKGQRLPELSPEVVTRRSEYGYPPLANPPK